jgi:hypothetical protein
MSALRSLFLLGVALLTVVASIWPAILNGFPLVYDDDSVYLAFPETIDAAHAQFYPMLVWLITQQWSLFVIPIFQSVVGAYVIYLGFGTFTDLRPEARLLAATILAGLTQLPWLFSLLTPDFLGGTGILAIIVLAFRPERNVHDLILFIVATASCLSATSNIAVMLPLAIVLLLIRGIVLRLPGDISVRLGLPAFFLLALMPPYTFNALQLGQPTLAIGSAARIFSKETDYGLADRYFEKTCAAGAMVDCWMRLQIKPFTNREEFLWGKNGQPALADEHDAWHDLDGVYHQWSMEILKTFPGSMLLMSLKDAAELSTKLVLDPESRDLIPYSGMHDGVRYRMKIHHREDMTAFLSAKQQAGVLLRSFPAPFYLAATLTSYAGMAFALGIALLKRDRLLLALCLGVVIALIGSTLVHGGLSAPIARYTVKSSWLAMFVTIVCAARLLAKRPLDQRRT